MHNFIISIISIVLISFLSLATFTFLGGTFTTQNSKSQGERVLFQLKQVQGAIKLYYATYSTCPANISNLTASSTYLNNLDPTLGTFSVNGCKATLSTTKTVFSDSSCKEFNKLANYTGSIVTAASSGPQSAVNGIFECYNDPDGTTRHLTLN